MLFTGKSRKKTTAAPNIATSAAEVSLPADVMAEVDNTRSIIADAATLNHITQVDELSDSLGNLNLTALCDMPTSDSCGVDSSKSLIKECKSESVNNLVNTNLVVKGRLARKITKQQPASFENDRQDVPKPVQVTGIIGSQSAGIMGKYSTEDRGFVGNYPTGDKGNRGNKYSADGERIRGKYSTNDGIMEHCTADNAEVYSADDSVFGEVIPLHLRIMRKMNKKSEKNNSSASVLSAVTTDASTGNFRPDSIGCDSSLNTDSNFSLIVNNYVPVHRKGSIPQENVGIHRTAEVDIEKEEIQEEVAHRMSYSKCEQKELSIVDEKFPVDATEMGEIQEDIPHSMSYICEHEDLPVIDENAAIDGNIHADIDGNQALDSDCGDGTSQHKLKLNRYASPYANSNTDICETDNLVSIPSLTDTSSHVDTINETSPTKVPNVLYRDTPGNQTLSNVSYGHFHMSGLCNTLNFSNHSVLNTSKFTDTSVILNDVENPLNCDTDVAKIQSTIITMETATRQIRHICAAHKNRTGSQGNVMKTDDTSTKTSTKSDNQLHVKKYCNRSKNNSREESDSGLCEKLCEITLNDNVIAGELIDNRTAMLHKPDENKAIKFDAKLPEVMDKRGDSYQPNCVSNRSVAEGNSDQRQKSNTTEDVRNSSGTSSEPRDQRHSGKARRKTSNRKQRKHLVTKASPLMDFSDDEDENINIHKVSSCADINRYTRIFNETTEGRTSTTAGIQITSTPVDTYITSEHRICEQGGPGLKVKKASPVTDFSANDSVLMGDCQHQHKTGEHEGTCFSKTCHKDSKIDHSTSCKPGHIPTTSSKSKHAPIMSLSKMNRLKRSDPSESKLSSENQVRTEFEVQFPCEKPHFVCVEPQSLGSVMESVEINLQSLRVKPKSVQIQPQSRIVESKSEIVKSQCGIGKSQSIGVESQSEKVKPESECVGMQSTSRSPKSAILLEHVNPKSHSNHCQPEVVKPKYETEKPKSVCVGLKYTSRSPQTAVVSKQVNSKSKSNHHQTEVVEPQIDASEKSRPVSPSNRPSKSKTSISDIRGDTNNLNESKPVLTSFMKVTTDTVHESSPVSLSQRLKLKLKNSSTRQVLRDFTNI